MTEMTARSDTISHLLYSGPRAPSEARAHLRDADLGLDDRLLTDLTLLVSEAVTNAVRHAGLAKGDPIDLTVSVSDDLVRARISQGGEPPPPPRAVDGPPARGTAGGWGLVIIDRVAERWGVERQPAAVWFELRRTARG
jgi:anti-sigma regulatory factor (Ser/Thr protein kinase)